MASGFRRVPLASRTVGRGSVLRPHANVAARAVPPRVVEKKIVHIDKKNWNKKVAGAPVLSVSTSAVKATRMDLAEIFPPSGAKSSPPGRRGPGGNSQGQLVNLQGDRHAQGSIGTDFSDGHKVVAQDLKIHLSSLHAALHFYTNELGWQMGRARSCFGWLYSRAFVKVGHNEHLHLIEVNSCDNDKGDDAVYGTDFSITIPFGSMEPLTGRLTALGLPYTTCDMGGCTISFVDVHGYTVEAEEVWPPLA